MLLKNYLKRLTNQRVYQCCIATCFLYCCLFSSTAYSLKILSDDEIDIINEEVNNVFDPSSKKVRDFVKANIGQLLMIGLPSAQSKDQLKNNISNIVGAYGVGSILVGRITNDNVELSDIIEELQKCANDKEHPYLFISAYNKRHLMPKEFDSPSFMSLPELTLSSSKNKELIKIAGQLQGAQLVNSGINLLLGPCVNIFPKDLSNICVESQRQYFGSFHNFIIEYATPYIDGLHESNIIVIGRHIPAMERYQDQIYTGEVKNALIDKEFKNYLDGVMISHLQLMQIQNIVKGPATFSQFFIQEIVRKNNKITIGSKKHIEALNFCDQLIISDDLSNPESIKNSTTSTGYDNIALTAFNAGNDILFFSTITDNGFTIDHIKIVREKLVDAIVDSEERKQMFRESLKRILLLKAKSIKSLCGKFEHINNLQNNCSEKDEFDLVNYKDLIGNKDQKDNNYDNSVFIKDILKKATIVMNQSNTCKLDRLKGRDVTFVFFINENAFGLFQEEYSNRYLCKFFELPGHKGINWSNEIVVQFENILDSEEKFVIIYSVVDYMDANFLNHMSTYKNNKLLSISDRLIIFLHNSPILLSDKFYKSNATIIGNFADHYLSYKIDTFILNGYFDDFAPITNLTIPIPNVYNPRDVKLIEYINTVGRLEESNQGLTKQISYLKEQIEQKEIINAQLQLQNERCNKDFEQSLENYNQTINEKIKDYTKEKDNKIKRLKKDKDEILQLNDYLWTSLLFILCLNLLLFFTIKIINRLKIKKIKNGIN